jgi:hypothetical protein
MLKLLNPLWLIQNYLTLNWVGAAVAIGGALLSNDSAQDGADAQVDSAQQGIDEIKKIGERTRKDTTPYRALGSGSASKLSQLLGIDIYGGDAYGGGIDMPSFGTNDLVTVGEGGEFMANEDFARMSPEYADAYKRWTADHVARYGINANINKNSDLAAAKSQIAQYFDVDAANKRAEEEYKRKSEAFRSDSSFGSLLKKFNQQDLDSDLVYQNGLQFGLDAGERAIENRARALGGSDSGSVLKALTKFGNDYGETKTLGAYNRNAQEKSNIYKMLMGGSEVGQSAVSMDANTGSNLATALAGQYNAQGNARSAGKAAEGNMFGSIAGAIGGMF